MYKCKIRNKNLYELSVKIETCVRFALIVRNMNVQFKKNNAWKTRFLHTFQKNTNKIFKKLVVKTYKINKKCKRKNTVNIEKKERPKNAKKYKINCRAWELASVWIVHCTRKATA